MPTPTTISDFLGLVRKSGLLDEQGLNQLADLDLPAEPFACAEALVKAHVLTPFQAKQLLAGRYRGLVLGAYKILRPLGKGGMGVVYLADHASLGRKVAIKVLTQDQAKEHLALERFYREARAAAALDHPNIVRLHDITQLSGIHFLVMEYVTASTSSPSSADRRCTTPRPQTTSARPRPASCMPTNGASSTGTSSRPT